MGVDVAPEIIVSRPRDEVAKFMFHPKNDLRWMSGIVKNRPFEDGPLKKGLRIEQVSTFLGREFAYIVEVIGADDDTFVEMAVEQPFPMTMRYELSDEGKSTRVRIRARGEPGGVFRLAKPLLASMLKKSLAKDLGKLKTVVEGLEKTSDPR